MVETAIPSHNTSLVFIAEDEAEAILAKYPVYDGLWEAMEAFIANFIAAEVPLNNGWEIQLKGLRESAANMLTRNLKRRVSPFVIVNDLDRLLATLGLPEPYAWQK